MGCPDYSSANWKKLSKQCGEDLALHTWKAYGEKYPVMYTNTELRQQMGIPYKASSLQIALAAKRVSAYNRKNGTAHSFKRGKEIGYGTYPLELKPNYLPVNLEKQRQREFDRSEEDKMFYNFDDKDTYGVNDESLPVLVEQDIQKVGPGAYWAAGEIYPTYEEAKQALRDSDDVSMSKKPEETQTEPLAKYPQEDPMKNFVVAYQGTKNTVDTREFNYFTLNKKEAEDYGKLREVTVNKSNFLDASSDEYYNLINVESALTGKRFDIFDNSPQGLKKQEQFFKFLKQKGYRGLDYTMRSDAPYLVSFYNQDFKNNEKLVEETSKPVSKISVGKPIFSIKNNSSEFNLTSEQKDRAYENYVNLMDRKREGKAVDRNMFDNVMGNLPVFKYKDTFVFGEWDTKNMVFKGRLISSPNIRELYDALDVLISEVNFMASVPGDIGRMLDKKGLFKVAAGKEFDFRGEEMVKNLYFSHKQLAEKVFGTKAENITVDQVKKYDSFFNYWGIIGKLKDAYANKNYDAIYGLLLDLGIYDYNAFRLQRKLKSRDLTEEDIKNVVEQIIRNSALNRVNVDKTDLLNNPEIYSRLDNELNKLLATYLSKFGIKVEMLENIQQQMGIDSFAQVNILNKIIYTDSKNQTDFPQEAGKLIAYMMQHNPLVQEIMYDMKQFAMFKNLTKDEIFSAIGDLISQELHKKTNTEIPKSLMDKIRNLIRQFLDMLVSARLNRLNRNIAFIADNVLLQNQSLITASTFKPGASGKIIKRISLQEALNSDKFGNDIVEKMSKEFILTGSITLSEQGDVFRPEENQLHDIDWVSDKPRDISINIFKHMYPESKFIRTIGNTAYSTDTFLIAPEGYRIENLRLTGETNKIEGYDIVNARQEIVSSYVPKTDSHTGEVTAKLIDIFSYPQNADPLNFRHRNITIESETNLRIADWRNTFKAKLEFGRLKDIWDYNRFIPKDNIYSEEDMVKEQNPQKNILSLQLQTDLDNWYMTPLLMNYLYENSTKRLDRGEFDVQAKIIINSMKFQKPNEDILDTLKCL